MKWIGALLVMIATTWIGFEWSSKFSNRPKQIRQLKNALQILEGEILYSQLPLQEAFFVISKQIPQPIKYFFQTLAEQMEKNQAAFPLIWEKEVSKLIRHSYLGKNEGEILYQFGRSIGQHDFSQQQKHIFLTMSHLDRELQESRDEQLKFANMAKSLGLLLGIFIVLVLL